MAFAQRKNYERSIADLDRVLELEPTLAAGFSDRGFLHEKKGATKEALADFEMALRLQPGSASVYLRRGDLRFAHGAVEQAFADYEMALQLQPRSAASYERRAMVYERERQYERAIADYQEAVHLDSRNAEVRAELAWLQATCPDAPLRNGREAMMHATRAAELGHGKEPRFSEVLAAAYAECGRFEDAVRLERRAIDQSLKPGSELQRLQLYLAKQPFRLPRR